MATRQFRTEASLNAETATRDHIASMLAQRGFHRIDDQREAHGTAITQIIAAERDGRPFRMHVRLCWRRDGRNAREGLYSAAQLRAKLIENDWDRTLAFVAERASAGGITHMLFVQDGIDGVVFAVLVPSDQMPAIWQGQRQASARIIASGETGRWTKNHAENGTSPTIWLQDDRWPSAHGVADVLWNWPGVINLLAQPASGGELGDDSVDDLPLDAALLGRDGGERLTTIRSGYRRDPKVRAAVLERAKGRCEREVCGVHRPYTGFLDVHHILGVGASDRVWTCVALCPNCHREAHFALDRDVINAELRDYARRFA
ncbi:HNH endonuclease signature motif containing protein [Sphingopyxis sp.]|uniref:HNH endonuclease n=1 Tax=Sphingopyxis sp. TaxID=1908224 RepID=UPI002ED97417